VPSTHNNGQTGTTLNASVSAGLTQDKTYAWDVTKTAESAGFRADSAVGVFPAGHPAGPGQQYPQVDHVFCRRSDITEFLFDQGAYTNRDVSCAKREIVIMGRSASPAS
jgi:hypothetical protein